MQPFTVRCYQPGAPAQAFSFFLLSKGRNTGRPAFTPWANCFGFACAPEDTARYYWLTYGLWQTGRFRPLLCGSVIEFIHIRDLRNCIRQAADSLAEIDKCVTQLQQLKQLEENLRGQLALISQARRCLLKAV